MESPHLFSVVRIANIIVLKKTIDLCPNTESHLFSGPYDKARALWSRLVRPYDDSNNKK